MGVKGGKKALFLIFLIWGKWHWGKLFTNWYCKGEVEPPFRLPASELFSDYKSYRSNTRVGMDKLRKLPLLPTKQPTEKDVDSIYQELKRPRDKEWQNSDKVYTIQEIEKFISEKCNLCLKFQQWDWKKDVKIVSLDIDSDTEEVRRLVDILGKSGALIFRTRKGYHCYFRVNESVKIRKQRMDFFFISDLRYDIKTEVYYTDKKYRQGANRQCVVPVAGTYRGEYPGCCTLYDRGKKVERVYTLEELIEAIDALEDAPVIPFEPEFEVFEASDEDFSDLNRIYKAIENYKRFITRHIGPGWEEGLDSICEKVRNAQEGRRNDTLYYATCAATLLGVSEDEIRERLLEVSKEIFTFGDEEFRNDYEGAKKTIDSGIKGCKSFLGKVGATGVRIRAPRKSKKDSSKSSAGAPPSAPVELHIVNRFKTEGAKFYSSNGFTYVLHNNYAVGEDDFAAYVLDVLGERLSEHKAKSIFAILASTLPVVSQGDSLVVLNRAPAEVVDVYLATSYGHAYLVKYQHNDFSGDRERVGPKKTQLGKLKDAFLQLRNKFRGVLQDEFDDLWNYIKSLPNDYYSHVVVSASLEDRTDHENLGFSYKTKDLYDIYLSIIRVSKDSIVDGNSRVYVLYRRENRVRKVPLMDLFEFLAGVAINPSDLRDEESKISRCKEILDFINKLLGRYTEDVDSKPDGYKKLTIRLCSSDDLRYNYFRWYLGHLASFHSYSEVQKLKEKGDDWYKLDSKEVHSLLAKSLLVLNLLATRGLIVAEGPSKSGKSFFLARCSVISNGEKVFIDGTDYKNLVAALFVYTFIAFDDLRRIIAEIMSKIKTYAAGDEEGIRLYHTITKIIVPQLVNICFAISAVDVSAMDEDMSRRGFLFQFKHTKFKKNSTKRKLNDYAGMDLLYYVGFRSLFITSIMKYDEEDLHYVEPDVGEFIARAGNPELALSYYKSCQIMGIDFDEARKVFEEMNESFAEKNLTGAWLMVYDMIKEKPKLLDQFKESLLAADIVKLLKENGFIDESEEKSVKDNLAAKARDADSALQRLGYRLTITKEGRYNKYKLEKIDSSDPDGGGGATQAGDAPQDSPIEVSTTQDSATQDSTTQDSTTQDSTTEDIPFSEPQSSTASLIAPPPIAPPPIAPPPPPSSSNGKVIDLDWRKPLNRSFTENDIRDYIASYKDKRSIEFEYFDLGHIANEKKDFIGLLAVELFTRFWLEYHKHEDLPGYAYVQYIGITRKFIIELLSDKIDLWHRTYLSSLKGSPNPPPSELPAVVMRYRAELLRAFTPPTVEIY